MIAGCLASRMSVQDASIEGSEPSVGGRGETGRYDPYMRPKINQKAAMRQHPIRSCGLREGLDRHLEPELFKSMQVMAPQPLGVQSVEMRWAQVGIRDAFAEDVPHRDEDAVAHRHGRLLGAASPRKPRIETGEVSVAVARGRPGGLDEDRPEVSVALAGLARLALARRNGWRI
jgi:hypothetical protein